MATVYIETPEGHVQAHHNVSLPSGGLNVEEEHKRIEANRRRDISARETHERQQREHALKVAGLAINAALDKLIEVKLAPSFLEGPGVVDVAKRFAAWREAHARAYHVERLALLSAAVNAVASRGSVDFDYRNVKLSPEMCEQAGERLRLEILAAAESPPAI